MMFFRLCTGDRPLAPCRSSWRESNVQCVDSLQRRQVATEGNRKIKRRQRIPASGEGSVTRFVATQSRRFIPKADRSATCVPPMSGSSAAFPQRFGKFQSARRKIQRRQGHLQEAYCLNLSPYAIERRQQAPWGFKSPDCKRKGRVFAAWSRPSSAQSRRREVQPQTQIATP